MSQILICDYCKKQKNKRELSQIIIKKTEKIIKKQRCKKDENESEEKIEDKSYDICEFCRDQLIKKLEADIDTHIEQSIVNSHKVTNLDGLSQQAKIDILEGNNIPSKQTRSVNKTNSSSKICPHMNKSQIYNISDKPYRICLDCQAKLPVKRIGENNLNEKLPAGFKMKDIIRKESL